MTEAQPDTQKTFNWKVLLVIGLVVILGLYLGAAIKSFFFPELPEPSIVYDIVELNDEWSRDERQWYYHTSQGSHIMPYEWYLALEQACPNKLVQLLNPLSAPEDCKMVTDPEFLSQYRLLPDVDPRYNEHLLPVGFAIDDPDPKTGVQNVGVSCAACHTAQLNYNGMGVRIDGAPGLLDVNGYLEALQKAALYTLRRSAFDEFAARVLGEDATDDAKEELRSEFKAWAEGQIKTAFQIAKAVEETGEKNTATGFGRIDALGQGGNVVYGLLDSSNIEAQTAPVNVIPLWYAHSFGWVQSNASIRQPMGRNIIEALAVNSYLELPGTDETRYESSVRMENMYLMEELTAKLRAPVWPGWLFGEIDPAKAAKGQALYQELCQDCHAPKLEAEYDPSSDPYWPKDCPEPPDPVSEEYDRVFYALRMFAVDYIGTDPYDAVNFADRRVRGAEKIGIEPDADGTVSGAAQVIPAVIDGIMQRRYDQLHLPTEEQVVWNAYRSSLWRACKAYPARPLAGTWATAPYLHNGSVPTLFQLLSPLDERDDTFWVGSLEFDPIDVGYETEKTQGAFKLDTSIKGNANTGHEFRDGPKGDGVIGRALSVDERYALIEYLKTLSFADEVPAGAYPPSGWVWDGKNDDYLYEGENAKYRPTPEQAASTASPASADSAPGDDEPPVAGEPYATSTEEAEERGQTDAGSR